MNFSALYHLISQAYLMKTKLLKEYLRLRNDLGLRQGSPFRATQDFSHICFVYRHNPLTGKTCFTIVKQSLFYQKSVYNVQTMFLCVCLKKQLTPPTFLPCISVKLKCHGSAKWETRLLQILCKRL